MLAARRKCHEVHMAPETARRLRELPERGDALTTRSMAGIIAASRTSELIPLCHPLALSHVDVTLEVSESSVRRIATSAGDFCATGVEMEALVAASVASLTVPRPWLKAIDRMVVSG